jgi:hypothetical protein
MHFIAGKRMKRILKKTQKVIDIAAGLSRIRSTPTGQIH